MIIVQDVFDDVQRVLGTCDEATTYNRLNEAIEELANIGNWDPMVISMDICTSGCEITLPDDVEVPLAVNIGGHPADFRNKWFEYHLNGPGTECCGNSCSFAWQDKGNYPTFRDPIGSVLIDVTPTVDESMGATIRVYGYNTDANGNEQWIMTEDMNGVLVDGFEVPIVFGLGGTSTVAVKRITRISKPITNGFIQINAVDANNTLLGLLRPSDTEPSFRRITVSGAGCRTLCDCTGSCSTWARMRVRRKVFKVSTLADPIPLHSVTAIKMMCQAIKKYEADLLDEYGKYFLAAKAALEREQKSRSGPNQIKIQFQSSYAGKPCDNMI